MKLVFERMKYWDIVSIVEIRVAKQVGTLIIGLSEVERD